MCKSCLGAQAGWACTKRVTFSHQCNNLKGTRIQWDSNPSLSVSWHLIYVCKVALQPWIIKKNNVLCWKNNNDPLQSMTIGNEKLKIYLSTEMRITEM